LTYYPSKENLSLLSKLFVSPVGTYSRDDRENSNFTLKGENWGGSWVPDLTSYFSLSVKHVDYLQAGEANEMLKHNHKPPLNESQLLKHPHSPAMLAFYLNQFIQI
jgi:hypothetical protein